MKQFYGKLALFLSFFLLPYRYVFKKYLLGIYSVSVIVVSTLVEVDVELGYKTRHYPYRISILMEELDIKQVQICNYKLQKKCYEGYQERQ